MESSISEWLPEGFLPEKHDPSADKYPLMGSFWPTAMITLAYLMVVWICLKSMKRQSKNKSDSNGISTKKPVASSHFDFVKIMMIIYNIIMIIYSSFMVIEILILAKEAGYGLGCVTLDAGSDVNKMRLVRVGYLFYFSKFVELFDTFFFLLRGKTDQVTFLHVFHHAAMPPSIWWAIKYAPGGIVFMFPLANSFVHIIMYTYYFLAAVGAYRFLWWKKYLTALQIVQFAILIMHQSQVFTINRDCNYPKIFPALICFYSTLFIILFSNFYVQAYWKRQRLSKTFNSNGKTSEQVTKRGQEEKYKKSNGYENKKATTKKKM